MDRYSQCMGPVQGVSQFQNSLNDSTRLMLRAVLM